MSRYENVVFMQNSEDCIHNHPTGDLTPSSEDRECARRLNDGGKLLGIPILDHLVIGLGPDGVRCERINA